MVLFHNYELFLLFGLLASIFILDQMEEMRKLVCLAHLSIFSLCSENSELVMELLEVVRSIDLKLNKQIVTDVLSNPVYVIVCSLFEFLCVGLGLIGLSVFSESLCDVVIFGLSEYFSPEPNFFCFFIYN